jgi:hypothetical protein
VSTNTDNEHDCHDRFPHGQLLFDSLPLGIVFQNAAGEILTATITIKDCTTDAVMKTFKGAGMFHRGGTLSADNSMPPPSRGAAMGIWKRGTGTNYTANMWFMRFNADGTLPGTQKVQRDLTLSADSNSLTGTLTLQIIDAAGAVVRQGCGTETAVRVY